MSCVALLERFGPLGWPYPSVDDVLDRSIISSCKVFCEIEFSRWTCKSQADLTVDGVGRTMEAVESDECS